MTARDRAKRNAELLAESDRRATERDAALLAAERAEAAAELSPFHPDSECFWNTGGPARRGGPIPV